MELFSNQELLNMMESMQTGLWRVEFAENIEPRFYSDPVMDKLLGIDASVTPEERFKIHHSYIHPDDVVMFEEYSDRLVGGRAEVVYRYIHPRKGELYVRCNGVRDTSVKEVICIKGTHQDISDTIRLEKDKLAEQRLAEENRLLKQSKYFSEQLYSKLLKIQTCGIIAYKLPDHEVLVANDMAKKLYGFDVNGEFGPLELLTVIKGTEYDSPDTLERLKNMKNPGDNIQFTARTKPIDGKVYYLYIVTQLFEMDNGDRIIITCFQDISNITELREINEKLEEQLDIVNSIAHIYSSVYYIHLHDGMFDELGTKANDFTEIIGKNTVCSKAMEEVCYNVVPEQYDEIKEFTDIDTISNRLKNKLWISKQFETKGYGWVEGIFVAAHRDDNGECDHVIWATRSIDETKRKEIEYQKALEIATEEAEKASAAKTSFLFNMSHDIRTPMNAIIGYTELLERNMDDKEKASDYLSKVRYSSEFLLSIINNVLEMARIESGKTVLKERACNIVEITEEVDSIYSELMSEKKIEFVQTIKVNNNCVFCDDVKLKEVFLNIISNAYKYTPKGGKITNTIEELPCEKEGYTLIRTSISDNGIGMSKEFLPILFEEFSREQTFTQNKVEGTGLGMPIVKRMVDLMGGTIEVSSELGIGTTFVITIPFKIAENKIPDRLPVHFSDVVLSGKRILLAEDNDLNAEIATEILSESGLIIERAEDGAVCVDMLEKAEDGYYDLILMDIQMPNMNGYEATTAIRMMQNKNKASMPIIAMTANAFEEDKQNAIDSGMDGHLSKPIEIDKVLKTLAWVLSEKR